MISKVCRESRRGGEGKRPQTTLLLGSIGSALFLLLLHAITWTWYAPLHVWMPPNILIICPFSSLVITQLSLSPSFPGPIPDRKSIRIQGGKETKKKKKKKRKRTRAQKGKDPHIITRFTPLWTSSHVRRGLKRVSHQIYYSSMIVVISAVKSWTLPRRNLQGRAGQLVRGRTVSSS